MDIVGFVFGISGLTFGLIGMSIGTSASKRVDELEHRLAEAGMLERE